MRLRWIVGLAALTLSAPLSADTKSACHAVFERAQAQRLEGKTRDAYESARQCALPSCPTVVRPLCAKWVTELEGELGSVTISVHDEQGQPISSVSATVDGAPSAVGAAIWIEKGSHRVVVEHDGRRAERAFDVAPGERGRAVVIVLSSPRAAPSALASPAPAPSAEPSPGPRVAPYVASGIALVGLGAFLYFGSSGKSDQRALESSCSPTCRDSDVDPIRRKFLFADMGLATALVGGGVATYLFLRPTEHTAVLVGPSRAALRLSF